VHQLLIPIINFLLSHSHVTVGKSHNHVNLYDFVLSLNLTITPHDQNVALRMPHTFEAFQYDKGPGAGQSSVPDILPSPDFCRSGHTPYSSIVLGKKLCIPAVNDSEGEGFIQSSTTCFSLVLCNMTQVSVVAPLATQHWVCRIASLSIVYPVHLLAGHNLCLCILCATLSGLTLGLWKVAVTTMWSLIV